MGYLGVKGARERWCKLGWERRCGPGANEEDLDNEGDCGIAQRVSVFAFLGEGVLPRLAVEL